MPVINLDLSESVLERLAVLADPEWGRLTVEDVLHDLIDHAQQGVYRPGSWERVWLTQVFGDDWTARMEPSGDGPFEKPREEAS